MIAEGAVLLRVERLQQSRGGITAKIVTEFVNFIQQKYRIFRLRARNTLNQSSGQRADIRPTMAANFRFVVHAAERNTGKFGAERPRNRLRQTGFTGAGRTDKAKDRSFLRLRQLPHRQMFQDPLFDFLQTEMIRVQYRLRFFQIGRERAFRVPRQVKDPVQIVAQNGRIRCQRRRFFQTFDFFFNFFRGRGGQLERRQLLPVLVNFFVDLHVIAELVANNAQFFTQIVFALIFIHALANFRVQLFLQRGDFLLRQEKFAYGHQPTLYGKFRENTLPYGRCKRQVHRDEVGHFTRIRQCFKLRNRIAFHRDLGVFQPLAEPLDHIAAISFQQGRIAFFQHAVDHFCRLPRARRFNIQQMDPCNPF